MTIAILTTLAAHRPAGGIGWLLVILGLGIGGGIGAVMARRVPMTAMPQLVAAFHSLVGLAAVLVAAGALYAPQAFGITVPGTGIIYGGSLFEMALGVAIGAPHLHRLGDRVPETRRAHVGAGRSCCRSVISSISRSRVAMVILVAVLIKTQSHFAFWLIVLVAFVLGVTLIIPIGGADMPVVVSMLNSYSGWAAAGIGFTLGNLALIITGALVGSSGAILSYIMCKAMNRSFISVILGGFGGETAAAGAGGAIESRPVKQGSADDAAFIMKNAAKVIIVPG